MKTEQLEALLCWNKRIQINLTDAGGRTFLGDPCPCVYLCIPSEVACTQKARSQGCPQGRKQGQKHRHKGATRQLMLSLKFGSVP